MRCLPGLLPALSAAVRFWFGLVLVLKVTAGATALQQGEQTNQVNNE